MKREQIEQWAREADCTHVNVLGDQSKALERLERFAALVAAHEREQCAKLCDDLPNDPAGPWFNQDMSAGAHDCAVAIRAMSVREPHGAVVLGLAVGKVNS